MNEGRQPEETPEVAFLRKLRAAEAHGRVVQAQSPTRENSLALTHVEDAIHRARRDCADKGHE